MDLICPLTDVQRAEYARICSEGLERLGDDVGAAMREKSFGFLALLTRLRQTCCDPDMLPWRNSPLTDSGKINLLVEKLTRGRRQRPQGGDLLAVRDAARPRARRRS
jgi:SNF2 family DNA or RNA helicase